MTLQPVDLDDLTWAELTTAIQGRIAPISRGVWTLHAPVDPGVTLLELFAWLLEQRLYWMDQVPETLVRAALRLLGQEPLPSVAAGTVLRFTAPAMNGSEVVAGHEMRLARRDSPIVFTTSHSMALVAVRAIELFSESDDLTPQLEQGKRPELFAAGAGTARLTLHCSDVMPVIPPAAPLTVLFDLAVPETIEPEWSPDAADVPPPAVLGWSYRNVSGDEIPISGVEDGTGGLRRSGVVSLPVPADWAPDGPADPATGLTAYSLTIQVVTNTFTAPPRIAAVAVNVARASHRRDSGDYELSLENWLPLPRRRIATADFPTGEPLKDFPPFEKEVRLSLLERDGVWHDWSPAPDLSVHAPEDRVFRVDRRTGEIEFGNGILGRVPVLAAVAGTRARLSYAVGGGIQGNLGRNLSWRERSGRELSAVNPVSARGGTDPENLTSARARLVKLLNGAARAVTEPDYVQIATESPGIAIARAHVAAGFHPCFPRTPVPGAITVFVVPRAPRPRDEYEEEPFTFVSAPLPDRAALGVVRRRLEAARLLGTELYVVPPSYRAVRLRVDVRSDVSDAGALRDRMTRRMRAVLDPLGGVEGGPAEGWPFGEPLRPSFLRHEAEKALDSRGQVIQVLIGLDGDDPDEGCKDVAIGPHDLVYLDQLELWIAASARESGGLR